MSKGFNFYSITKTIILSLFVLFFGVIYIVYIKNDEYNPADLLETYILETENNYYQVNKYSGHGTYEGIDNILNKSTDSNIVSIELYVHSEDSDYDISDKRLIVATKNDVVDYHIDNYSIENNSYNDVDNHNQFIRHLVNINNATVEELDTLPKIGSSIANAIIKYREKYGDFKSIEQIKNVTGIGEKIFESIKDMISV